VASVLLVEDDSAIAEPLVRALEREGHEVAVEADGVAGAAAGVHGAHDLVILDLGLPGLDGLEVCRLVRAARPAVPILMLTARSDEIDAIIGLDAGADDYQAKPFRLGELMARVRALVRRAAAPEAAGNVRVDGAARRAFAGDRELALPPTEFDLLALLVHEAGRVVRRDRIMEKIWDDERHVSAKALDMHVSSLRRKLGDDPSHPRLLSTVRGVGLRFEAA
jgi:DNA-binding response OmpR family regulator